MEINQIIGHYGSNTFVITHNETVLIVDAGAPIEKLLKQLNGKIPNAILITHGHFDHIYHLKDYQEHFGCKVYTPNNEKPFDVCGLKINPFLCPGHSPDSVAYLIEDNLFTGDVLFADTIGRTDLMKDGDRLMQKTLHRLLGIKFAKAYHGHGKSSSYKEQQENIKYFIK